MRLDQADRIMLGDREVSWVYLGANMVWGNAFSPASLFAQGEPGVWYDPSDFSTMFQGAAGTTHVTAVEQPVGLMLDKSKGLVLGPELVVNGGFSDGTTGWTATNSGSLTVDGSGYRVTNTLAGSATITQSFTTVVGKSYAVSVDVLGFGGRATSGQVRAGTTAAAFNNGFSAFPAGQNTFFFTASATTTFISVVANSGSVGAYGSYDNISVRELPGNRAYQTTATARPIYRASPARIDFDTVDDALITTFPASLGSNCTIARAIPGVGAQILTGQAVGTTFSDTTDHAGLVIINRALTPSETTALTAYLTAKVAA